MRGTQMVSIATLATEVGDLTRFDGSKQLIADVGLMPSEQYSGTRTQRQREEAPVRDLHSLGRRAEGTRL